MQAIHRSGHRSPPARQRRGAWGILVLAGALAGPTAAQETDTVALADRLGEVFQRSMKHWRYDYGNLEPRKAGVACIPWQRLDAEFLDNGIFDALGFSFSVAKDEMATKIADQGCNQMKTHYKLTDCECEPVLLGETIVVTLPE